MKTIFTVVNRGPGLGAPWNPPIFLGQVPMRNATGLGPRASDHGPIPLLTPGKDLPQLPALPGLPDLVGFHGKDQLTLAEANELSGILDKVLAPMTPEEQQSAEAHVVCRREIQAGSFPIVSAMNTRLKNWLAAAKAGDTFQISKGELQVTGRAVQCAAAIGRVNLTKTIVTAAGIGIPAGALLLLLL